MLPHRVDGNVMLSNFARGSVSTDQIKVVLLIGSGQLVAISLLHDFEQIHVRPEEGIFHGKAALRSGTAENNAAVTAGHSHPLVMQEDALLKVGAAPAHDKGLGGRMKGKIQDIIEPRVICFT